MVKLAESVVTTADQRQHFAGVRIHRDQSHLSLWAGQDLGFILALGEFHFLGAQLGDLLVHQLDATLNRLRRGLLQVGIKRRINPVGLIVQLVLVQFRDQLITNQVDEIRRVAGLHIGRRQSEASGLGLLGISPGNGVGLNHRIEHQVTPLERALWMPVRRQRAWRLNDSSNQCRFRQRNLFQILVEIRPRRFCEPTDGERPALTQVHAIGIELENLLLRELLLEFHGDQDFDQLAFNFLLRGQEESARKLHGDGRAALLVPLMGKVDPARFRQPDEVHTAVLEESAIFNRDHRIYQDFRNLIVGDDLTLGALFGVEQ